MAHLDKHPTKSLPKKSSTLLGRAPEVIGWFIIICPFKEISISTYIFFDTHIPFTYRFIITPVWKPPFLGWTIPKSKIRFLALPPFLSWKIGCSMPPRCRFCVSVHFQFKAPPQKHLEKCILHLGMVPPPPDKEVVMIYHHSTPDIYIYIYSKL